MKKFTSLINKIFSKKIIFSTLSLIILLSFAKSDLYKDVSSGWRDIYDVYKRININYSDNLDPEVLSKAAIDGMLSKLDPYSTYLIEDDNHNLNIITQGNYGGVGIQLGVRDDTLTVISPMDNSPAQKAGIISGDKIIKVDSLSTFEMRIDNAASKIRGPENTNVKLTILRWGSEIIEFHLTRSKINIKDISYSGLINAQTAYIRLNRFSRNSIKEMRSELSSFNNLEVENIIIDFRGNPGGLLDSAVDILDLIIQKGNLLVSISGRTERSQKKFFSQNDPIVNVNTKIAILIDGGSASASEIVAGTIQDLDRGVIIGSNSFGKGLVQTAFPIDSDRTLKITTAKYYIPSGRLIQKKGYIDENIKSKTSLSIENDSVFTTINGREVFSNGGISPDYFIEDKLDYGMLTKKIWQKGYFFQFATKLKNENPDLNFLQINDNIISDFKNFILSKNINLDTPMDDNLNLLKNNLKDEIKSDISLKHSIDIISKYFEKNIEEMFDSEKDDIKLLLTRDIIWIFGGLEKRIESSFENDPVITKALNVFNDEKEYYSKLNTNSNSIK
tara:strand:- start:4826 stop:6505 length:1680 start_codon:yes stop_codon:yes gene_type:complete